MLLLPFIENAFKYGISLDRACFIQLSIIAKNGNFKLEVNNSIFDTLHIKGNETGLANTKKLLSLLYGDKYTLVHGKSETKYHVTLSIPVTRLFT